MNLEVNDDVPRSPDEVDAAWLTRGARPGRRFGRPGGRRGRDQRGRGHRAARAAPPLRAHVGGRRRSGQRRRQVPRGRCEEPGPGGRPRDVPPRGGLLPGSRRRQRPVRRLPPRGRRRAHARLRPRPGRHVGGDHGRPAHGLHARRARPRWSPPWPTTTPATGTRPASTARRGSDPSPTPSSPDRSPTRSTATGPRSGPGSPTSSLLPRRSVGDGLAAALPLVAEELSRPPVTLAHGDLRLDNLFFHEACGVRACDWQLTGRSRGMRDLAVLRHPEHDAR